MIEQRPPVAMIVEDDPAVRQVVRDYLVSAGYRVEAHGDGVTALRTLRDARPDVLVLDRMLPGISGDELCREARAIDPRLPIIMLTALDAVEDRIDGLERGADDYLAKPFALRELLLRVNALVRRRRAEPSEARAFDVGPFRVDPARRAVLRGGRPISLTSREYELLLHLIRNPDRVVSREELLREVWGWDSGDPSNVTVHVRRLREKIEPDPREPQHLVTEWGAGYRFVVAVAP
ncbi:response regulator transcription factor [Leifsonia sp. 2MCAF36]|uniref:response regulator transcription factor n=1 Tax=Leifsonia sp. 2MCAF36 TaxID=3232988 RepID=UPI003F9D7871